LLAFAHARAAHADEPTTFNNWKLEWKLDGNGTMETEVWDTAGQEGFEMLRTLAYPGTKVYIVAYDSTSMTSWNNVNSKWIPELENNMEREEDMWVILCATKVKHTAAPFKANGANSSVSLSLPPSLL